MRVLMTTDNIGGVWTFATDLAKGLNALGIDVTLAVTGNALTVAQREDLRGIPFYFAPFKQEWMDDPWEDVDRAGKWLLQIAGQVRPHVVHLNSYTWGSLGWKAPVVITLHSCVLSWWRAVKKHPAPESWNRYRNRVSRGIRAARVLTAPTQAMLKSAETIYGPFEECRVIPNGRNSEFFRSAEKQDIIFSMGRLWDEAKNIRLLLQASRMIPYPIYIAGERPERKSRDIPDHVHFTGHLDCCKIAEWLSKAAVYALPVRYEPFGYSFLEAAFSGCALVGGDIPSLREIWKEAMIYVDPDKPAELANTINMLFEQQEKRKELSAAALLAAGQYILERMLENYRDLYNEVRIKQRTRKHNKVYIP